MKSIFSSMADGSKNHGHNWGPLKRRGERESILPTFRWISRIYSPARQIRASGANYYLSPLLRGHKGGGGLTFYVLTHITHSDVDPKLRDAFESKPKIMGPDAITGSGPRLTSLLSCTLAGDWKWLHTPWVSSVARRRIFVSLPFTWVRKSEWDKNPPPGHTACE